MRGSVLITHRRYVERMQHREWLVRVAIQQRRRAMGIMGLRRGVPHDMHRICETQRRCMSAIEGLPRGLEDSVLEAVIAAVLDSSGAGELTNGPTMYVNEQS